MNRKLSILLSTSLLFGALNLSAKTNEQSKELKLVQKSVQKSTNKNLTAKRQEMMKEAIDTIHQTALALKALDNNKPKEAIDILAKVTGKIDMIVARDPNLKLLPISITQKQMDVLVTKEMIKSLLYDATKALKEGRVQDARHMLANLGSEIIITTTSIPLATYPTDIKAIAPLIDKGKIDEAKIALQDVLNSMVVSEQIIPLPILRASYLLVDAEKLASKSKRDKKENQKLSTLLKEARYQLQMGELLGYGTKEQFKDIYHQIDMIKAKTANNHSGNGWFDKIKSKISKLVK